MMNFNLIRNKKGFTLIEMIIALSIFVLVALIATNIYLTINNSQRRVVAMQKIQDDVRYVFEAMAQEIRLGRINYSFYQANSIDLHPLGSGNTNNILALINQTNSLIFFRLQGTNVQYCEEVNANDCDLTTGTGWQAITPTGVEVQDLRFIITPSADPFSEVANSTVCTADSGKTVECQNVYGYSCPTAVQCPTAPCYCQYFSDGHNYQPKVRIILKTKGVGRNKIEETDITMQTTVTTRIFPGEVLNTYHD